MNVETQPEIQATSRVLPNGLVESKLGDTIVYVRPSDGWIKVSSVSIESRNWKNWHRQTPNKKFIQNEQMALNVPVVEHITSGLVASRGYFAHPRVAMEFAGWVSPAFKLHVNQLAHGVMMGDLNVVAQTVANHDAIQDTTSVVAIQSIGNNLFAADNLTLEQKRAKSIELTKRAHDAIARKGASRSDFVRIHDGINNAAFDFCGPTQILRDRESLPRRATPRSYAQPDRQQAIIMMTILATGYYNQDALSKGESQGKSLHSFKVMGDLLKDAGISTGPLLREPIVPDRSLEEGRPPRPAIAAGPPMGIIRNQRQIDDFFNPRAV